MKNDVELSDVTQSDLNALCIADLESATEQFRVALQKVKNAGFDIEWCQHTNGPSLRNEISGAFYLELTPKKITIGDLSGGSHGHTT